VNLKKKVLSKLYTPEQINKICNGEINLISITADKKESKIISTTLFDIILGFIVLGIFGIIFQLCDYNNKKKIKNLKVSIK
jgi:hypothetical protein